MNFENIKFDYSQLWRTMIIDANRAIAVRNAANKLILLKPKYAGTIKRLPNIPWYFVALVHKMECNSSFNHHLHNGDPLKARTVHVPKGRPAIGKPPFSFEDSAVDALVLQNLHLEKDWSIEKILFRFEEYNGMGYRLYRGINSPYLWAATNHYKKGKYLADGKYSSQAVSNQIGIAPLLKYLWNAK